MSKKKNKRKKLMNLMEREIAEKAAIIINEKTLPGARIIGIGSGDSDEFGPIVDNGQELYVNDEKDTKCKIRITDCSNIFKDQSYAGTTLIVPATIDELYDILNGKALYIGTQLIASQFTFINEVFKGNAIDVIKSQANDKIERLGCKGVMLYIPYVPTKNNPDVLINILYMFMPYVTQSSRKTIFDDLFKAYGDLIKIDTTSTETEFDYIMGLIDKLGIKSPLIDLDSFAVLETNHINSLYIAPIYDTLINSISKYLMVSTKKLDIIDTTSDDGMRYLLFNNAVNVLLNKLSK